MNKGDENRLTRKNSRTYAAFAAFAVILFLVVGELGVRLINAITEKDITGAISPPADRVEFPSPVSVLNLADFVPDPVLIWRNRPNNVDRYGATLNNKGFRGPEFSEKKPDGTFRVVCLGDSTTYGHGLPDGAPFPRVLESILREKSAGKNIAVINAGVPGYSSYQGLKLLENEALEWQPDVVIISFGFDDHLWAGGPPDEEIPHGSYLAARIQGLLGNSAMFLLIRRMLAPSISAVPADPDRPVRRVSIDSYNANLTRIVSAVREAGAVPYLMTQPVNPFKQLVINPIRRVIKDPDGGRRVVFEMHRFVAGQDTLGTYRFDGDIGRLIEVIRQRPDWPMPHYLLGMYYADRGEHEKAVQELDLARKLDNDRSVIAKYNETVRQVAAREKVTLIDLSREFEKFRNDILFTDDVHFNIEGAHKAAEIISGTPY